jgi:hypothetical protein
MLFFAWHTLRRKTKRKEREKGGREGSHYCSASEGGMDMGPIQVAILVHTVCTFCSKFVSIFVHITFLF